MMKHSKKRVRILIMSVGLLLAVLGLGLLGQLRAQEKVVFITHHLDNARTGWNPNETQFTPQAFKQDRFHKLWETAPSVIRGQVYGAPLFYSVNIEGVEEEFLLVADEMNFFYALDARDGSVRYRHQLGEREGRPEPFVTQEEWNFKLRGNCIDLNKPTGGGPHGVTGTGVIDPDTGIWYLSNLTMEDSVQVYKVHAINVLDGGEVPGWPVTIQGGHRGRSFDAFALTQRSPLTLLETDKGKVVYVTFAARCDSFEWSGWVAGISINDHPAVTYLFSTTPDGNGGGIWGPGGISIDRDGKHGYIVTGNGTTNWSSGGLSYAMSVMKLDLANPDDPFDYGNPDSFFTPTDFAVANSRDADFGGSSLLVVPDQDPNQTSTPHLLFTASKSGRVYLLDRDKLGARNEEGAPMVGGHIQQMRVNAGARTAPAYFKDDQGRQFIYVTGCDENTFPNSGTYLDWQDPFVTIMGDSGLPERAALGTGPSMIEFSPPKLDKRLFIAWTKFDPADPDNRAVLIKSSSDGSDWSPAVEVGGPAAVRTSPALAVFRDKLYIAWIDAATRGIVIKSSPDGVAWSAAQTLNEVAPNTYTSMAVFRDRLYVAYISSVGSEQGFSILVRSFDGTTWSGSIPINARQTVPISAPLIIPFIDPDDNPVLYAFWVRNRNDRAILFKKSNDGTSWPTVDMLFNESANRESGLSGMVLNTVIEGQPAKGESLNLGPPRLFILFLTDSGAVGQNNTVFAKSIDKFGTLEAGGLFFFHADEVSVPGTPNFVRAFTGTKVGATSFRGQPVFTYVRPDGGSHDLRLKMGALGYRGGGLAALQLYVDPDTKETRFFPAWTAGRRPGTDVSLQPTAFDYLPGSPFVTSDGGKNGIVWVFQGGIQPPGERPGPPRPLATLHAYDAITGEELFNSLGRAAFDQITLGGRKFAESVAVNGRIFLGSNTYFLDRNGVTAYGVTDSK
jgi:hypothetical protein